MAAELTAKQQAFVQEYLIDFNATQAAIRAGYSPSSAGESGCENLKNSKIKYAIDKAKAVRSRRTGVTPDRVIQELARLAFFDPRNATDDLGNPLPMGLLGEDESVCISEIRKDKNGELKLKFYDKQKALDTLAKHLKLTNDTLTLEAGDSLAQALLAARERAQNAK